MCSPRWIKNPLVMTDKLWNRTGMSCMIRYFSSSIPLFFFFIFPSSLWGRWVQQLKKRDARVSDKLIKLSLLSIICTVKKRNLIVFAVPDKPQEKCLHIFSVLSLFLILIQCEHYTFMALIKSQVLEASQMVVLVQRCVHLKKYLCEI